MIIRNSKLVFLFLLSVFFIFSCKKGENSAAAVARGGVLDLRAYDFSKQGNVSLRGEWEFYWQSFVSAHALADAWSQDVSNTENFEEILLQKQNSDSDKETTATYINVPSAWNAFRKNNKAVGGLGFATYRLSVLLPQNSLYHTMALKIPHIHTAYRLYINGELQEQIGTVATEKQNSISAYRHIVQVFFPHSNSVDIVLHVANFNYSKGGLLEPIYLGEESSINRAKFFAVGSDLFIVGALLIMSVYHFGLFFLRSNIKAFLYFAIFTFLFFIRIITRGEMIIDTIFPSLPFIWQIRMEYLSFYITVPVFYWFLLSVFPNYYSRRLAKVLSYVSTAFAVFVLLTPPLYFTHSLLFFQVVSLMVIILILVSSYRCARDRVSGAVAMFTALFIFGIIGINDIFYMNGLLPTMELSAMGLFVLVFTQALILSSRMAVAFKEVGNLSKGLEELTAANSRFVPQPILELLNKKSILDVHLGDNMQKKMSIIFAELNNFQEISEQLDGTQKFRFINQYLNRMGPIIRNHDGFIDKYLGSGFMSIFPQGVDPMLQAGIAIQKEITALNLERKEGDPLIEAGMGAHIGELMLGTIGEEQRIDATVISDAVNISSRLKDLTKIFHASFIVSAQVKQEAEESYYFRKLGVVKVKGKTKPIAIYEILDCYPEEIFNRKMQSLLLFEKAVSSFERKDFAAAEESFKKILKEDSQDYTVRYYIDLVEKLLKKNTKAQISFK